MPPEPQPPARRRVWPWAAVLAVGVAARLGPYLDRHSFWYDEAYLLLNVLGRSYAGLLGPLDYDQAAPPLFVLLLRLLADVAGPTEWAMRLPAFAAGLAALAVMVPLARRVVGDAGAVWAVALAAACYRAVNHGCEVKPYTVDVLATCLILLAAIAALGPPGRGRTAAAIGLPLLAAVGPWASFPSVFVLGAAALALLLDGALARRPRLAAVGAATGLVAAASFAGVIWLVVRRTDSPTLWGFWSSAFIDTSSVPAAAAGCRRCLFEAVCYATPSMGGAVAALAVVGAAAVARRRPALAVLLTGPAALAVVAAGLRRYPLADRLTLFLAPTLWLLAACGAAAVRRHLPARVAAAGWLLPAVVVAPGLARGCGELVVPPPRAEFREAFALVEARRQPGDVVWVSHPEVYRVYYRSGAGVIGSVDVDRLAAAAAGRRVWLVGPAAGAGGAFCPAAADRVAAAGGAEAERRQFARVEVRRYEPGGNPLHAAGGVR